LEGSPLFQSIITDVSPPLAWSGVPADAKSLVLIVDEPDATDEVFDEPLPKGAWVHWVLYNIPPSASALPEGVRQLPAGTLEGVNSWGQTGYRGPCPHRGSPHHYFHRLFALDLVLADLGRPSEAKIWEQPSRIIAQAGLVGTYQRLSEGQIQAMRRRLDR
jgi:Raf kinase inhibitor-like YbhB/YbcL family protein